MMTTLDTLADSASKGLLDFLSELGKAILYLLTNVLKEFPHFWNQRFNLGSVFIAVVLLFDFILQQTKIQLSQGRLHTFFLPIDGGASCHTQSALFLRGACHSASNTQCANDNSKKDEWLHCARGGEKGAACDYCLSSNYVRVKIIRICVIL